MSIKARIKRDFDHTKSSTEEMWSHKQTYAMIRVQKPSGMGLFPKEYFIDSNVLVGGRMITGHKKTKREAMKIVNTFLKEQLRRSKHKINVW